MSMSFKTYKGVGSFLKSVLCFVSLRSVLWFVLRSVLVVRATSKNMLGNCCKANVFQCLRSTITSQKVCQTGDPFLPHKVKQEIKFL